MDNKQPQIWQDNRGQAAVGLWSDQELLQEVERCLASEQLQKLKFLLILGEIDERKIHLKHGFSSLFQFCVNQYRLSEGSVYRRIQVARAIRRYPVIAGFLARNRLSLTTVSLLCPYFTSDNVAELLRSAEGKTKRQLQLSLPGLKPVTIRNSVRRLPLDDDQSSKADEPSYRYQFVCGEKFNNDLQRLTELTGISPNRLDELMQLVVADYLKRHDPSLVVVSNRDRQAMEDYSSAHRYIPKQLRIVVLESAGYQCCFRGEKGQRCSERRFLEIDHIVPISRGGKTELSNLQVLCRAHNRFKSND